MLAVDWLGLIGGNGGLSACRMGAMGVMEKVGVPKIGVEITFAASTAETRSAKNGKELHPYFGVVFNANKCGLAFLQTLFLMLNYTNNMVVNIEWMQLFGWKKLAKMTFPRSEGRARALER